MKITSVLLVSCISMQNVELSSLHASILSCLAELLLLEVINFIFLLQLIINLLYYWITVTHVGLCVIEDLQLGRVSKVWTCYFLYRGFFCQCPVFLQS